jgi:molybdopterin converting factor small subunit
MPIRTRLPSALSSYIGGNREIALEAQMVEEVLSALEQRFPSLVPLLRDESGALRPRVNIYVNDEHIRFRQGLETPLRDGDTVFVMPIIMGG